jgi:hypothetical protein
MNDVKNYPYGECECAGGCGEGCSCNQGKKGPVAFDGVREGREARIRLCTRCIGCDDECGNLLVTPHVSPDPFNAWHPVGAGALAAMMAEKELRGIVERIKKASDASRPAKPRTPNSALN